MLSFLEHFARSGWRVDEPWLVVGKGPSFAERDGLDLRPYRVLSLNHVVERMSVSVAHVVDYDVVADCADALERNAGVVAMPWFPHVHNRAGTRTLEELAADDPVLARLDAQGRLLYYNASSAGERVRDGSPVIRVVNFSAEAALNLLVAAGVRRVRSLGVDGGASYSATFGRWAGSTLLSNGRADFDAQFAEFARTIRTTGVDFAPLTSPSPVRVYVAATQAELLPTRVLEHSIRKHCSMSVDVVPLCRAGIAIPRPRDRENAPRTPFSFQRFLVPQLAEYRGRAIYLDSDMLVFADLRRLWQQPFDGADVLTVRRADAADTTPQTSVMVLDCERLRWDVRRLVAALDAHTLTYEQLMHEMRPAGRIGAVLDPVWNSLDRFEEGRTALLHYTEMPTQPWVHAGHPLGTLWAREILEAIDDGAVPPAFVEQEVRRRHVRPSLLYQLEHRLEDGRQLPGKALARDRRFRPPYTRLDRAARRSLLRLPADGVRAAAGSVARAFHRWTRRIVRAS